MQRHRGRTLSFTITSSSQQEINPQRLLPAAFLPPIIREKRQSITPLIRAGIEYQ